MYVGNRYNSPQRMGNSADDSLIHKIRRLAELVEPLSPFCSDSRTAGVCRWLIDARFPQDGGRPTRSRASILWYAARRYGIV